MIPAKASVFSVRKTHRRRHAPREPFVPLPKKILETRISTWFPRIFHFCTKSRLCLQNRRFPLIFPDFPNKKGVNLVSHADIRRTSALLPTATNIGLISDLLLWLRYSPMHGVTTVPKVLRADRMSKFCLQICRIIPSRHI